MKKLLTVTLFMMLAVLTACGSSAEENEDAENNGQQQSEETVSVIFRHIDLKVEDHEYVLTGEVQSMTEVYYTIEQEGEVLQEEERLELEDSTEWTSFEISGELPESVDQSKEPPVIVLYGKNEQGEQINPNYIPIDLS